MSSIIFNTVYPYIILVHRHYHAPTYHIYTDLSPKLTATASVAQSVQSIGLEIQGRGFNSQPEALVLHFSQLVPVNGLKMYYISF